MIRHNMFLIAMIMLYAVSIHATSNEGNPKHPIKTVNFKSSSIDNLYVINTMDLSALKEAALLYRKMEENQRSLQVSLKAFMRQMMEMMNETRQHIQQMQYSKNITNARLQQNKTAHNNSIDGRWLKWSEWSNCSAICGEGISTRTRTCEEPVNGGRPCQGNDTETKWCNNTCPVDGRWLKWSEWSNCSAICGEGISTRTRTCEEPVNGGRPCQGNDTETKWCNNTCPENLAKGKFTYQSSTAFGGVSSRAVDGNTNPRYNARSCTHTRGVKEYWYVDLGAEYSIRKVVIYNRMDNCCSNRLQNTDVYVVPTKPTSWTMGSQYFCDKIATSTLNVRKVSIQCGGLRGRFVAIRKTNFRSLSLCEVEVFK